MSSRVKAATHVLWFKRDLRLHDHSALYQAAHASDSGKLLLLYLVEPELWQQPDMSYRHYQFLSECLAELQYQLSELATPLAIKVGNAISVFQDLHQRHGIATVYSHQETWNYWTYQRDQQLKKWFNQQGINWQQPVQNGVIRCLNNRNGWARRWYQTMQQPILAIPTQLSIQDQLTKSATPCPTAVV